MLRNNKGMICTAAIAFYACTFAITVTSVILTPKHRARKVVEFCQVEGFSESYCKNHVADMSKENILAYIRDDGKTKSIINY